MSETEVKSKVQRAIKKLLKRDRLLFVEGLNERTICAKLACYLSTEFKSYDVDVEYNRKGKGKVVKKMDGPCVLPDIIVHTRTTTNNLIAMEAKKHTHPDYEIKAAKKRLRRFKENKAYNYQYALLLSFTTGQKNRSDS